MDEAEHDVLEAGEMEMASEYRHWAIDAEGRLACMEAEHRRTA